MRKQLIFFFLLLGVHITGISQQQKQIEPKKLSALIEKAKADTNTVQYLLDLSDYYLQSFSIQPKAIDSALLFAKKAEALCRELNYDKGLGNSYIAISKVIRNKQEEAASKNYINKAIQVFTNAHLYTELGFAYWELSGHYSIWTNDGTKKILTIENSVASFHKAGNIKKEADALKELADVRQIDGNYGQALLDLKKALKLYQSINEPVLQGVYDLMGAVTCSMGNLNEAVQYGLLAVQTAEKLNDTSLQLCTIYNRLGITYFYLKDYNNSSFYYQKALAIAKKYKAYNEIYQITNNCGNNLIMQKKHAECNLLLKETLREYPRMDTSQMINYLCSFIYNYSSLKEFSTAEKYFTELNSVIRNRKLNDGLQRYVNIAAIAYLLASGQNRKARIYLEDDEKYLTRGGVNIHLANNQLSWIKYDSAVGDYTSAFRHFRNYIILKDSIYSEEKSKYIEQLNIQFETAKKDQDIQLKEKNIEILKKEAKLKQTELLQANQTRNWILAAILLLFVIIGLLVSSAYIKQQANKKLTIKGDEIERKNNELRRLVDEKEWLVKEIHHRVKNNFHIVQGLLGTQSGYLKNPDALSALADSRHRVQAMSLIHQKLYQSDNLSAINMADYIHELVSYLKDSFRNASSIQFKLQVDPIDLDLSHCIPLGLIMNEAVTNAIKYAFPDRRNGIISIVFKQEAFHHVLLSVSDNGVGLPGDLNIEKPATMGMRLMKGLSEDIESTFSVYDNTGTTIELHFKYDPDIIGQYSLNTKEMSSTI